jgi:hypothetical protein
MSSPDERRETLRTADRLTAAVEGLRGDLNMRFAFLARYGRVNRRIILVTIISLVFDLALTGLFIKGELQVQHNQDLLRSQAATISELSVASIRACQGGNLIRTRELGVWEHIISITKPPANETQAERAKRLRGLMAFKGYLKHAYAPRNCATLYGKP